MARQLPSGLWTSKLGESEDIEHQVEGLEGSSYGNVLVYLCREIPHGGLVLRIMRRCWSRMVVDLGWLTLAP